MTSVLGVLQLLFLLVGAHALCDYPLQGDFLARAKNQMTPIAGVPWYQALGAHACIHGLAVYWITGSVTLGVAETALHAWIDFGKSAGHLSFNQDQALHVWCKLCWALTVIYAGALA